MGPHDGIKLVNSLLWLIMVENLRVECHTLMNEGEVLLETALPPPSRFPRQRDRNQNIDIPRKAGRMRDILYFQEFFLVVPGFELLFCISSTIGGSRVT